MADAAARPCGDHVCARRPLTGVIALLVLCAACSQATQPGIGDTTIAFAVRTALVNDASVGSAPIDVVVRDGVVTLTGLVASGIERDRALTLARRVEGVLRVDDRLNVSSVADAPQASSELPALPPDVSAPGQHLGIGAAFTKPTNVTGMLEASSSFSPAFRFGRGGSWHPVVNWVRLRSGLRAETGNGNNDPLSELRMSVVAIGLGYGFTGERISVNPGVSIGYSFTHVRLDPGFRSPNGTALPVAATGAPAMVAGTTVWFETTRRMSVGFNGGYILVRPQSTWLLDGRFERRPLRADAWVAGVGLAYWVF
ncbi:MAG: BON domain-containing protein [Vicinamibacterales bacterium]